MQTPDIDRMVREHFESCDLPAARLDELADVLRPAGRAGGRRRVVLAAAAAIALSFAMGYVVARSARPDAGGAGAVAPRLVVVQVYAEWCRPSQVVADRLAALRSAYEDEPVMFVNLDLTDDERRRQAGLLMEALGYADIWAEQKRTGELLVIDGTTHRLVDRLTDEHETPQMVAAIDSALRIE